MTAMACAVADDSGSASFAAQFKFNSGMVSATLEECASRLTDSSVNTTMCVKSIHQGMFLPWPA